MLFRILSWIYASFSIICIPFLQWLICIRIYKGLEDSKRYKERFGITSKVRPQNQRIIWFHAASVGESLSLRELLKQWHQQYPQDYILVTTITKTAAEIIEKQFANIAHHQYLPMDSIIWINRYLNFWKPDRAYFTESEIWPNLLNSIRNRSIPTVLLNANLSEKSFQRWSRFPKVTQKLFSTFNKIYVQHKFALNRFQSLGIKNVILNGNLKFSSPPLSVNENICQTLKSFTKQNLVFVAASTHSNEELIFIDAFNKHIRTNTNTILCLVPRHPNRTSEVIELCIKNNLKAITLEELLSNPSNPDHTHAKIIVIDRIGILGSIYHLGNLIFIGGSFIEHGGHNPIEPAHFCKPIIYGPYMKNFKDICELFDQNGAIMAHDPNDISDLMNKYSENNSFLNSNAQQLNTLIKSEQLKVKDLLNNILEHAKL